MAWGMLPSLGSAMCACTWHFFYNSPDLQARGGPRRCGCLALRTGCYQKLDLNRRLCCGLGALPDVIKNAVC
jgi:hypothetical protein